MPPLRPPGLGSHRRVQAPELLRRLTTRLGMKLQHSPELAETIQPVIILDDIQHAKESQGLRTFYRSQAFVTLGDGAGHTTIMRLDNPPGSGVIVRLRDVYIEAAATAAIMPAQSYAALDSPYAAAGTTYGPVVHSPNMLAGGLSKPQDKSKAGFSVSVNAPNGITAGSPFWLGFVGNGGFLAADGRVYWRWYGDYGDYGPQFQEGVGVDVVVSNLTDPGGSANVGFIWQEEPTT